MSLYQRYLANINRVIENKYKDAKGNKLYEKLSEAHDKNPGLFSNILSNHGIRVFFYSGNLFIIAGTTVVKLNKDEIENLMSAAEKTQMSDSVSEITEILNANSTQLSVDELTVESIDSQEEVLDKDEKGAY